MDRLCFATYAELLKAALQEPNDNQPVAELLLEPIISEGKVTDRYGEILQITPKMVSDLFLRKKNIHRGIKSASVKNNVIDAERLSFKNKVFPSLNPHAKEDFFEKVDILVNNDASISSTKRTELLNKKISHSHRLADIFLYSINVPNKLPINKNISGVIHVPQPNLLETTEDSDLYLLIEANGMCPLCGTSLVIDKNGHSVQQYEIISIYPSLIASENIEVWKDASKPSYGLSSNLNRTVLCPKCAKNYMSHTSVDEYQQLLNIKQSLLRNYNARTKVSSIELEDQIGTVLRRISSISPDELPEPLNYDALLIRNKIEARNFPLIIKTEGYVVNYYSFIKELFTQLESEGLLSFNDISIEVNMSYKKLLKQNLTQDEIFTQLVNWFKIKSSSSYDTACEVIVAFFVQNCEVFDEITK